MEKKKGERMGSMAGMLLVFVGALLCFTTYGLEGNGGYDAPYFQADYIQDLSDFSSGIVNPALLYRVNQYQRRRDFTGGTWRGRIYRTSR